MGKKIIGIFVCMLLCMTTIAIAKDNEENCYGIALPIMCGEGIPYTSIQQSTSNMVNDLLRMNISVYWAASNFSALSIGMYETNALSHLYEKGTFVVPLTGNLSIDALIICIAHDYGSASEIEDYYPIEIYHIMEPLSAVEVYPLNYAKVAYNFGEIIHPWMMLFYLDTLQFGGFFDNRLLLENEIAEDLDNDKFNLFICPGGIPGTSKTKVIKTALHIRTSASIRQFVERGGGYMGSCYGARMASSGMIIPINLLQSYFKKLPATLFLSLIPSSYFETPYNGITTIRLLNMSHPVVFGLEKVQKTWHMGPGPAFLWVGDNAEPLAVFEDVAVHWLDGKYKNLPPWIIEKWINFVMGKPSWVTSQFGKGKAVVFSDHPEMPIPSREDRLIHNAAFYTTAGQKTAIALDNYQSYSKVETTHMLTDNLDLPDNVHIFNEIWNETDSLIDISEQVDILEKNRFSLARELTKKGKIDGNGINVKISTIYDDSYQRMFVEFSYALRKLERVYSKSSLSGNVSSDFDNWKRGIVKELKTCKEICVDILESGNILLEQLEKYKGSSAEKLFITHIVNKLDLLYKRGYNHAMQPWQMTVKLYRDMWYEYESKQSLAMSINQQVNHDSIKQTQKPCLDTILKDSKVLFVNDDALVGGNGSLEYPYRHIQDAIDAASYGYTIIVDDGIYYESPIVDKSVKILGNDRSKTIIDGRKKPHHLIFTTAPNVEISGFTIRNSSIVGFSCGVCMYSSNNIIRGNIFTNNCAGIGMYQSGVNNTIADNIFVNNSYAGIVIDEIKSSNITVSGNIIKDNGCHGLYLVNADVNISSNIFINNGITIFSSDDISFKPNIANNAVNDKPLYCYKNEDNFTIEGEAGQIILFNCSNAVINDQKINGTDVGIYVIASSDISIINNVLIDNLIGICLQSSENVAISNDIVKNSRWSGISLDGSDYNNISENTFDNNDEGMLLYSSSSNNIENNSYTNNVVGISIWSNSSLNNKIYSNDFIDNNKNAYDVCYNLWERNYWDDWIGLNHPLMILSPYHIPGKLINFDWYPMNAPYQMEYGPCATSVLNS